MKFTFRKRERLSSKVLISMLFGDGTSFFNYPFKVISLEQTSNDIIPVKVLISVSKRSIKSAVKRNLIKRQIREVYRKNKHILHKKYNNQTNKQLLLALVFTGKTNMTTAEVERKLIIILHGLTKTDVETSR